MTAQPLPNPSPAPRPKRLPAISMVVRVDGKPATLIEISEDGVRLALRENVANDQMVSLSLQTLDAAGREEVVVRAQVRECGDGKATLIFVQPTYALMKMIVHYLARRMGQRPHAF